MNLETLARLESHGKESQNERKGHSATIISLEMSTGNESEEQKETESILSDLSPGWNVLPQPYSPAETACNHSL